MAVVYLLRCRDGSLYCGWTTDLERRVAAHASGRASKYTASRLPVAVAGAWRLPDASAARRAEWALKQLPKAAKESLTTSPTVRHSGPGEISFAPLAGAERIA